MTQTLECQILVRNDYLILVTWALPLISVIAPPPVLLLPCILGCSVCSHVPDFAAKHVSFVTAKRRFAESAQGPDSHTAEKVARRNEI